MLCQLCSIRAATCMIMRWSLRVHFPGIGCSAAQQDDFLARLPRTDCESHEIYAARDLRAAIIPAVPRRRVAATDSPGAVEKRPHSTPVRCVNLEPDGGAGVRDAVVDAVLAVAILRNDRDQVVAHRSRCLGRDVAIHFAVEASDVS